MRGCQDREPTRFSTKAVRGRHERGNTMIGMLRIIRWTALGLIALIALGVAVWKLDPGGSVRRLIRPTSENTMPGIIAVPAGTPIGGPFGLIDDKGRPVTDADYRGRW